MRPILSGVKHAENGDLLCTDSHRLYVAKGVHDRTDGAVLTPAGKNVDGNFPDVSRLIPDSSYAKQSLEIEVSELFRAADMIASIGSITEKEVKSDKPPALEFKEDIIRYNNFQCQINYSFYPLRFEEYICANAIYLLEAMKLLKAAGCQIVTLNFYGKMRPFTLTNEDESLLVLILPIRKY
ncbi:DNA polymerase III sliding clamp (beta) subunit (PCNA family) [Neobacillus drentensis]|nr:DNA polymerase III sliding clamp (beta) subunit (PCNA family) [Neobacillus drentensis]